MPLDPDRVAEVAGWLRKASEDLRAGEFEMTDDPPITGDAAFHAQQAVEKSLKGFLAWHDRPFRKTHNLVELGEACATLDASLTTLLRQAAPLTEYAWKFRYPGEPLEPSPEETQSALTIAREVHREITRRIPSDTPS